MAGHEEGDGQRHGGRQESGRKAVAGGVQRRRAERHAPERVGTTREDPVHRRSDRHAERRQDEKPVGEQDGYTGAPEVCAHEDPLGPRPATADPAPAAGGTLADEHEEPEQDEHERESTGHRGVDNLEFREDLCREGREPEDLEGAVLGQDDKGDEEAAAENSPARLAEGDAEEGGEATDPQAAGDLLLARVRTAQARRHGQVDERVDGKRHHENCSPKTLHPG